MLGMYFRRMPRNADLQYEGVIVRKTSTRSSRVLREAKSVKERSRISNDKETEQVLRVCVNDI